MHMKFHYFSKSSMWIFLVAGFSQAWEYVTLTLIVAVNFLIIIGYKTSQIDDPDERLSNINLFGLEQTQAEDIFFYIGVAILICGVRKLLYL